MKHADDLVLPILTSEERRVLRSGLVEWGGPARCTDLMAAAMGFGSVDGLFQETGRLIEAIEEERPLSRWDWTRALLATEIVFASNVIGAGHTWSETTDLDDVTTMFWLRKLQSTLGGLIVPIGPPG